MVAALPLLLATGLTLGAAPEQGQVLPESRVSVTLRGGGVDDQAFARLAMGLDAQGRLDVRLKARALAAVEATDRFRNASLDLSAEGAMLRLDPWPRLVSIRLEGAPKGFSRLLPGSIRAGSMPGPRRLADACARMGQTLQERGYPDAKVTAMRSEGDRQLVFRVEAGRPRIVQAIQVEGPLGSYTASSIQKLLEVTPGRTLWYEGLRNAAVSRIRKRFVKDERYEGGVELIWNDATGLLIAKVDPGPQVEIRLEGKGMRLRQIRRILPLVQAERHSPDLLDQGDRRILRILLSEGCLDAKVTHRREVVQGTPEAPSRIAVTYALDPGPAYVLKDIQFRRNQDLTTAQLDAELSIPRSWWLLGDPAATPDLLDGLEERLRDLYRRRGYADVAVRRLSPLKQGHDATAIFDIREGQLRQIRHLVLDLTLKQTDAIRLAAALGGLIQDQPGESPTLPHRIITDRSGVELPEGTLRELPSTGTRRFLLTFDRPLPLIRTELQRMLNQLRQRILSTGVQRPRFTLGFEPWEDAPAVHIQVSEEPRVTVKRLAVQGSDATRAKALLRETQLLPGTPLDPDRSARTQGAFGGLGGFQHVDLSGLLEVDPQGDWEEGDLITRLEERSPWVISHAFGYDKSQGYHMGFGVQRLNLGGMGRTLDLGIRAGDGTIQNPALRRIFPTGLHSRSVDMYSLGYSDPRADATLPGAWLPVNTRYRLEGAYIHEQRSTFLIRRRRILQGFDWQKEPLDNSPWQYQSGLRYEHVTVASAIPGIRDDELNTIARMPPRVTIVAPYFQVIRDRRDNPMDPTRGSFSRGRIELANQAWGTSANSSFVKVDLSHQWLWPLGPQASWGVASLSVRLGMARPTASTARDLPLSERFFAGGPFTHRGVEPDWLGWESKDRVPLWSSDPPYAPLPDPNDPSKPRTEPVPVGGQGLVLINLEVRFPLPLTKRAVWGELFVDSGQVQRTFFPEDGEPRFRPLRTALGVGLIFKVGLPIKAEYAWDLKRILGKPQTPEEKATRLKNVLLSAGFQF